MVKWGEDGFLAMSDITALENEMSLVSMAADEAAMCIHIREWRHKDLQRQKHGGGGKIVNRP